VTNKSDKNEATISKNVTLAVALILLCIVFAGTYFEQQVLCFSFAASLPGLIFADYWYFSLIRLRPFVVINLFWVVCGFFVAICVDFYVEKMPGYLFALLGLVYYFLSAIVFGVSYRKFPIVKTSLDG
jgi:hypothetical protein